MFRPYLQLGRIKFIGTGGGDNVTPPVFTVAPQVTGNAVVGQPLTCDGGTVTGTEPITKTYQWYKGASPIIGATNLTYTLLAADAGNTSNIYCEVTATNVAGIASADSNTVAVVYDATANTFITNARITDNTQKLAVNFEMYTLKAGGVTSGYLASYPLVGASASTHKFNMFNPLDTDAAKRLVFSGTITHDANGMQGNGTNGIANTFVNPSLDFTNDFTAWVYIRTATTSGGARSEFGVLSGSPFPGTYLSTNTHTSTATAANFSSNSIAAVANTSGLWLLKRVGTTATLKRNNVVVRTYTASSLTLVNGEIRLMGVLILPSTIANYSNKQYTDYGFLNVGTSDAQDTAIFNAVVGKETILGRNI